MELLWDVKWGHILKRHIFKFKIQGLTPFGNHLENLLFNQT
jgi:hypothetical protein